MRQLSTLLTTLSAVALLSFSASSFAAHNYKGENYKGELTEPMIACPMDRCLPDGPYIGLGAGYDMYRVKQGTSINPAFGVPFNLSPSMQVQGWMGTLFAGYGQYFNVFYFAGEIFGSMSDASTSNSANDGLAHYNENYNVRNSYGVSVLPGIKVAPSTLLFARLGYTRTSFNTSENVTDGVTTTHTSRTVWSNGLNYGAGFETAVFDHFSFRGEYIHTNYDSFNSLINTNYKPHNNQVIASLIYHFPFM